MTDSTTRRQEILDAAAELFAGKGVGATPIREIADRVGVVAGALYHHFPSKQVWLSIKWHRSDDAYPTAPLAEDCVSIFLDGFAVDQPRGHRAGGHGSTHAAA